MKKIRNDDLENKDEPTPHFCVYDRKLEIRLKSDPMIQAGAGTDLGKMDMKNTNLTLYSPILTNKYTHCMIENYKEYHQNVSSVMHLLLLFPFPSHVLIISILTLSPT